MPQELVATPKKIKIVIKTFERPAIQTAAPCFSLDCVKDLLISFFYLSCWFEPALGCLTARPHVELGDNAQSHSHLIVLSDFAAWTKVSWPAGVRDASSYQVMVFFLPFLLWADNHTPAVSNFPKEIWHAACQSEQHADPAKPSKYLPPAQYEKLKSPGQKWRLFSPSTISIQGRF